MTAVREPVRHIQLDEQTAELLIEAASVVGRPLGARLRYKLMAKARSVMADAVEAECYAALHEGPSTT